jgi:single-stranded DNA-binding protein
MTKAINKVFISGNTAGRINFHETGNSTPACSFSIASDRRSPDGPITAWVKINAYGGGLVSICKKFFTKGGYVLIEGELMNREGQHGDLMEVRAKELIFLNGGNNGH